MLLFEGKQVLSRTSKKEATGVNCAGEQPNVGRARKAKDWIATKT